MRRLLLLGSMAPLLVTESAAAQSRAVAAPTVARLRATPGPRWQTTRSPRFRVYLERVPFLSGKAQSLTDSLEAAWQRAEALVGAAGRHTAPVHVFVTVSRTRFSDYLRPYNRGLATSSLDGTDLIVLVHNDSVRAYTAHEVMHVVARRAWGGALGRSWLEEGLATYADGRCQSSTIHAVARDHLRQQPFLQLDDVVHRFPDLVASDRAVAYALAGTVVGYLWELGGREGVRRVWLSRDPLAEIRRLQAEERSRVGRTATRLGDLSAGWREHVHRVAGTRAGLAPARLRRFGCG